MPTPYNLDVHNNCVECDVRSERIFCDMSREAVASLDTIKFTGIYPKGSLLFVEGEEPRGVFILCNGRVKLTTSSTEGKTLIVKVAEVGEVLGASATILGKPYEVSAETLEPSQMNFIKRDDFLKFLQNHADACLNAAQHLSENCQNAYEMIRSLGLSHSVSEKLARLLLEWSSEGEDTKEGIRIKVSLTHEEMAQLIGTSRETVTRVLGEFRDKNLALLRGSTLLIKNKAALEQLVGC